MIGLHVGTAKAARWLNKPERTIRDWCEKGKLEGAYQYVFNSSWLIPLKTLEVRRPMPADLTLLDDENLADLADLADLAVSDPTSLNNRQ